MSKDLQHTHRLDQLDQHNKIRSQTACSYNSYIKPRSLVNFSVDYSAFERFQAIKRKNHAERKT